MMSAVTGRHDPRRNTLLAALPPGVLERLMPHFERVSVEQGHVLIGPDQRVERVCFPTGGLFSLVVRDADGAGVEAAVVGREGMLGSAAVLGAPSSPFEELCQIDDGVLILPAEVMRSEFERDAAVRDLLLCYVAILLHTTARNVACNRLHVAEQRLARWLLQVRDRVESDVFFLTQEFLGHMLGVRRPTVTEAVAALERLGLIRHQRGRIRVLDDAGLESAACEDYARIRDVYATMLGA
jgi:CRP-like cAMP-binding protein